MLNLKAIRILRHLTQESVAESVGISRETYSRIENGRTQPSPENAMAIAEVMGFVNWFDCYTSVTTVQWKGESPI